MELSQLPFAVRDYARNCLFVVHALGFSLLSCVYMRKVILWFLIQDNHKGPHATNLVTLYIQVHGESS